MFIYSISNPENQQNCQAYSTLPRDPVIANSTHSYVTLNSNTTCGNNTNVLQVYDTKDLTNPKLIHSRTLTQPKGISFIPLIIYWFAMMLSKIFNIQNPAEPVLVHAIDKIALI
jgi:hypothetical protein